MSDLRLELAALRTRVAELEATVERIADVVLSSAAARAQRIEQRREREIGGRYGMIQRLLALLPGGHVARKVRLLERVADGRESLEGETLRIFRALQAIYGDRGPSRRTIYLSCQSCKVDAAQDGDCDDVAT